MVGGSLPRAASPATNDSDVARSNLVSAAPGQQVIANHATLLLGALELLRRAQWALFRLEFEQICRAASEASEEPSTVPLGFGSGAGGTAALGKALLEGGCASPSSAKSQRVACVLRSNRMRMESQYVLPTA